MDNSIYWEHTVLGAISMLSVHTTNLHGKATLAHFIGEKIEAQKWNNFGLTRLLGGGDSSDHCWLPAQPTWFPPCPAQLAAAALSYMIVVRPSLCLSAKDSFGRSGQISSKRICCLSGPAAPCWQKAAAPAPLPDARRASSPSSHARLCARLHTWDVKDVFLKISSSVSSVGPLRNIWTSLFTFTLAWDS